MMRLTIRAIFIVALLMAVVLSFNLLVGAQVNQETGDSCLQNQTAPATRSVTSRSFAEDSQPAN